MSLDDYVSAEFQRLAEIINDYDQYLFLEMVPVADQLNLIDKSKVFRIVDDRNKKIVLYADSLANPQEILARLWGMDQTRGNVLTRMDCLNAAKEALALKERLDEIEAQRDFALFIAKNTKSRWYHDDRIRDEDFNDLGPKSKVIR